MKSHILDPKFQQKRLERGKIIPITSYAFQKKTIDILAKTIKNLKEIIYLRYSICPTHRGSLILTTIHQHSYRIPCCWPYWAVVEFNIAVDIGLYCDVETGLYWECWGKSPGLATRGLPGLTGTEASLPFTAKYIKLLRWILSRVTLSMSATGIVGNSALIKYRNWLIQMIYDIYNNFLSFHTWWKMLFKPILEILN